MIRDAAAGDSDARRAFARIYEPVVIAYLRIRWHGRARRADLSDAAQDVFVECLRPAGALSNADSDRGGFRGYLYGVVRNVAARYESKRTMDCLATEPRSDESSLGHSFDRAFARSIMKEASRVQAANAELAGAAAIRRVELLRLRFQELLPIREIAVLWNEDPARLHHEHATARREFRESLQSVVKFHYPDATDLEIIDRCSELIGMLK